MLDRLDRLVLAGLAPRTVTPEAQHPQVVPARPSLFAAPDAARDRATTPTSRAHAQARGSAGASGAAPSVPTEVDHITSKRGPRFADYTTCPMCGHERLGLEYQGELLSGVRLHTLAAHSPAAGRTTKGQPRCLGAGMRMKFVAQGWVSL